MKTKLSTLFVLLISTIVFGQDNWKTLEKENYSINYPNKWIYSDKKPQPTIEFLLLSEEGSQKEDLFRENINMAIEDLKGNTLSLEEYTNLSIKQIKSQIPTVKIASNTVIKVNNIAAKVVVWSADFGDNMKLKFKQMFLINNNQAYVFTFSSSKNEYDNYIKVGDKILNSFKLKK